MKKILILFFIIPSLCSSQKIIKVVQSYVLIDTDKNIGNINDELIVQRLNDDNSITDIGKIQIVKFAQNKTAAKILMEFGNNKIRVNDSIKGYIIKTETSNNNLIDSKINNSNQLYKPKNPKRDWRTVCPDPNVSYCSNVGKFAHNNFKNPPILRGVELGKIIGVTWRPKGSIIEYEEAIPSAGIPEDTYFSPKDAYYYIIDDGSGEDPFLRACDEIDAK